MAEQEVVVCEAMPEDAKGLSELLKVVTEESDFITKSQETFLSEDDAERFILKQLETLNQICLLVKVGNEVVGVLNIASSDSYQEDHIGDLFIAIKKAYWGYGLGHLLMEAAVDWAEHTPEIRRLELTVQVRNERAVHLYETIGFTIEGVKKRGAKTKNGEFLDVYAMAKLID